MKHKNESYIRWVYRIIESCNTQDQFNTAQEWLCRVSRINTTQKQIKAFASLLTVLREKRDERDELYESFTRFLHSCIKEVETNTLDKDILRRLIGDLSYALDESISTQALDGKNELNGKINAFTNGEKLNPNHKTTN